VFVEMVNQRVAAKRKGAPVKLHQPY
jgi:hypothetical protein